MLTKNQAKLPSLQFLPLVRSPHFVIRMAIQGGSFIKQNTRTRRVHHDDTQRDLSNIAVQCRIRIVF